FDEVEIDIDVGIRRILDVGTGVADVACTVDQDLDVHRSTNAQHETSGVDRRDGDGPGLCNRMEVVGVGLSALGQRAVVGGAHGNELAGSVDPDKLTGVPVLADDGPVHLAVRIGSVRAV